MTVAELIAQLRLFPQGLKVEMTMNGEFQDVIEPHFLKMQTEMPAGNTYVIIDNWAPKEY